MNIRFESPQKYVDVTATKFNDVFEFKGKHYIRSLDLAYLLEKVWVGGDDEHQAVIHGYRWMPHVHSRSIQTRFPKAAKVQVIGRLVIEL